MGRRPSKHANTIGGVFPKSVIWQPRLPCQPCVKLLLLPLFFLFFFSFRCCSPLPLKFLSLLSSRPVSVSQQNSRKSLMRRKPWKVVCTGSGYGYRSSLLPVLLLSRYCVLPSIAHQGSVTGAGRGNGAIKVLQKTMLVRCCWMNEEHTASGGQLLGI